MDLNLEQGPNQRIVTSQSACANLLAESPIPKSTKAKPRRPAKARDQCLEAPQTTREPR
jgi:hypothetical protein